MKKLLIQIIIILFHNHTGVFSQTYHALGETRLNALGVAIYQPNCTGASLVKQDTFKIGGPKIFKLRPDTASRTVIFRCRPTFPSPPPLLIVDGALSEYDQLNDLDPNEILSISILKNSSALSVCDSHATGVIVITTKRSKTFVIKDFLDNKPIANATILLTSTTDSMKKQVLLSDENGIVKTEKIVDPANDNLTVSAIGYKSSSATLKTQKTQTEIFPQRDYKECREVIVFSSIGGIHCRRRGEIFKENRVERPWAVNKPEVRLYPNPIKPRATLTIEWKQKEFGDHLLQLFNQSGQLIFSKDIFIDEKTSQFKIGMPSIIAGNYFLKLTSKATSRSYAEKLIVD